jgi:hypothetical protein
LWGGGGVSLIFKIISNARDMVIASKQNWEWEAKAVLCIVKTRSSKGKTWPLPVLLNHLTH